MELVIGTKNRPSLVLDGPPCVGEHWSCFWVSKLGRCRRALAPHYSSMVHEKSACTAFVSNGRTLEELERGASVIAMRSNG